MEGTLNPHNVGMGRKVLGTYAGGEKKWGEGKRVPRQANVSCQLGKGKKKSVKKRRLGEVTSSSQWGDTTQVIKGKKKEYYRASLSSQGRGKDPQD